MGALAGLRTGSITISVAVRGPRFKKLKIGAGHRLDVKASGVFGGSGGGAAACPAVREVMGVHAGKKGGCAAIALLQPLDLTALLGAEVLKQKINVPARFWQS